MRFTLAVLAATTMAATACQPSDLTTSGSGNHNNTMTAQVMASDASHPTGPASSSATVSGTVTFSGLTVELWNGQQWLAVTNGAGSATINVGDGSAAATLVPATEIPAGDYTKARISAANAAVDVTVNGQGFSARFNPSIGPFEIEKTVSVTANADGSRTFSVQFVMISSVSLGAGANGPVVQFNGDLGGMSAPATTAPGSVVASDVSQPTDPSGARVAVSGTVTFTGLSVELWDGQQWLSVAHGSGSATVNIGDGSAAATLVPVEAIPAGSYTKVRISATDAVAQLTADLNGQQFAAQVRPPSEPFVIEKDVSVTVNADGSRTFAVQLEMVRTVSVTADAITGAPQVNVTGDINGL
jgi:hypothetical protein